MKLSDAKLVVRVSVSSMLDHLTQKLVSLLEQSQVVLLDSPKASSPHE
jgi:hypothetical protein